MCLRFVFLLITRVAAWLRLSQREEAWQTAEILILRHQLAVLQRRPPRPPDVNWAGPARDPARRDTQSGEPVPDLVKVVLQIGLELRYRHPVHAGRALIRLDLLPRLPDSPLRDAKRLARCFQLVHATPPPGSPGVDRTNTVTNDPAPFAPPSLQGHQRYYEPVRQRAPRRYSAPCGSAAWVTPCRTAP